MMKLILIQFLTAMSLLMTGCGSEEQIDSDTNKIIARAETSTYQVRPAEQVFLTAEHSLIGESQVTYSWLNSDGLILGTEATLTWNAPLENGAYTIILVLNLGEETQSTSKITITVNSNISPFSTIQKMIGQSQEGTLTEVTYICIGDSTRVNTTTPDGSSNTSRKIFEDINASLTNYHVTSYLVAQGGLTFKAFNGDLHYTVAEQDRPWIHVQEAIDHIPGDGATTIIDISMGSNDFSAIFHTYPSEAAAYADIQGIHEEIKSQLLRTINTIKASKPRTKFMLTATNPFKDWEIASDTYLTLYKEVAIENNLPFANFVDDIMPERRTEKFDTWYLDGIHFNETVGQLAVSEFVLKKILPTP